MSKKEIEFKPINKRSTKQKSGSFGFICSRNGKKYLVASKLKDIKVDTKILKQNWEADKIKSVKIIIDEKAQDRPEFWGKCYLIREANGKEKEILFSKRTKAIEKN
ncbi:MAG: hypothetical protein R6U26_02120 [Candidatus Undinarchaeales archaeon]